MENFLYVYQHLPEKIDPVALRAGSFSVGWYALMYILAFLTVYLLLRYRIRQGEISNLKTQIPNKSQITNHKSQNLAIDFLFYALLGVLIGGRLGYVIFYNLPFYLAHPVAIISPFSETGQLAGIYGMSYHGGLIGVIIASLFFVRNNRLNFWRWADFVIPAIPAGYFFGRIGNFLNGELFGRATNKIWGMYFPADSPGFLRHPSQLYEAFFEGLVLFIILWTLRPHPASGHSLPKSWKGAGGEGLPLYIFFYGLFRFFIEFFREPDPQIGLIFGIVSLGQLFSLLMIMAAAIIFAFSAKKRYN